MMSSGNASNASADTRQKIPATMEEMFDLIQQKFDLVPKATTPTSSSPQPLTSLIDSLMQARTGTRPKTTTTTSGGAAKPSFQIPRPPIKSSASPIASSTPAFHFSSSVPSNVQPYIPKIPCFSGDEPSKGEVPYMVWRYEVECLAANPDLSPNHIFQATKSSLRGSARLLTIPLGTDATTSDILEKLDAMYSNASSKEELMTEFFNSAQQPNETVIAYACRLETLLQTVVDRGHLPGIAKNDLLRHKFWTGLSSDSLKLQTRHKYDYISDYNTLLREIRQVEKEISTSSQPSNTQSANKKVQHHPVAADSDIQQQVTSLTKKMESMESKMDTWEKKIDSKIDSKFDMILQKLDNNNSQQQQSSQQQYQPRYNRYRGRGRGRHFYQNNNNSQSGSNNQQQNANQSSDTRFGNNYSGARGRGFKKGFYKNQEVPKG